MRAALLVLLLVVAGCGVRPSAVIEGVEAPSGDPDGALLFLVSDGAVVPVVRPFRITRPPGEGEPGEIPREPPDPFALLAAGPTPDERALGLTSEVPAEAVPTDITPSANDGVTVRLPIDVTALSALAAEQLACTTAPGRPVTLVGDGTSRAPVTCVPRTSRASGRPLAPR
jgi:hypothetical protein